MRSRQDALKFAALASCSALALGAAGCGAIFHGSQTVEIVPDPAAKAVVYQGGVPLVKSEDGAYETQYFLNNSFGGSLVAIAPGKRLVSVEPEQEVSIAAILCDTLWTVTIIGVAAPISDALLGTFTKIESPVEVAFVADDPSDNPMPVYHIGGESIAASEAPVAARPAVPAAGAPSPEPDASSSSSAPTPAPTTPPTVAPRAEPAAPAPPH